VTFPANFGTYLERTSSSSGTATATSATTITLNQAKAGAPTTYNSVGTITIPAGGVKGTFASTSGLPVNFSQGDSIQFLNQGTADSTFGGFFATLEGYETMITATSGPTLVTHGHTSGNGNITTSALTTTGADLIVITVAYYTGGTVTSVTDSLGNVWTLIFDQSSQPGSNAAAIRQYYCINPNVGASQTFTLTASGEFGVIAVEAWNSNGPGTWYYDLTSVANANSAGGITPSGSNAIEIASIAPFSTDSASSIGSGFTISDNVSYSGGANMAGAMAYLIETTPTNKNPAWTVSAGTGASMLSSFVPGTTPTKTCTIDGHVNNTTATNGTTSTITLTTSQANDIIVVAFCANDNSSTNVPTATGVSGASLGAFTKRASISNTGGNGYALEVWYATASSALSGEVITITYAHSIDCSAMVAFGVHGATQWDPNGALPATVKATRSTAPVTTLTSTNTNTMLLQIVGGVLTTKPTLQGAGFTYLEGCQVSHALDAAIAVAYTNAGNAQSGMSIPWGQTITCLSVSDPTPYYLDALSP
jgi:hypothetical protein